MFVDVRAETYRFDEKAGRAVVRVAELAGGPLARVRAARETGAGPKPFAATLLLDAKGSLVGVDLGGDGLARCVVMLGRHEDVASTTAADIELVAAGAGRAELVVHGAGKVLRGAAKNPYVGS